MGAAADQRPDPELQRQPVRWRPGHRVRTQLQHPVRQARHARRPRGDDRRHPSVGHRRATPDRPAQTDGEHLRRHRQPGPGTPAAGHPRLRPERGADGAAAHGDGCGDGRQRRPDDGALRGAGDLRQRESGTRPDQPPSVEDPDLADDGRDRTAVDDRCGRARHRELLHRTERWGPSGRQDGHRRTR